MDASGSFPKLTPVLLPRPSSQPSPEKTTEISPALSRSRSALPERSRDTITPEPKPEPFTALGGEEGDPVNMHTTLYTPNVNPLSSAPLTPRPYGDTATGMHNSHEIGRPLNVTDALSYLDAVKVQFQDKPDVYNHFLDIMKDFKSQVIDTPGVIDRVSMLFHGNPGLIQGFNTFLPFGYRIDISADPHDPNTITVTTPMGTSTQSTNTFVRHSSEVAPFTPSIVPHPTAYISGISPLAGDSSSIAPHAFQLTHGQLPFDATYSPGLPTTAAASFLGNLINRNPVESQPQGQFNHAIQYLNKIKARYSDDSNKYKQFLDILQTYQKEQRHLHDSQVYVQVQCLFKDAPDLLSEFRNFLPDSSFGPSGGVGIVPQQLAGSSSWGQPDISAEKAGKRVPSNSRRKRRPAERDLTPAPPTRAPSNRSKRAKHHHKPEPQSPPFSPHQRPLSPDDHPHPHGHSMQTHYTQPLYPRSVYPSVPSFHHAAGHSDELLFFDRAKKALENRETYDEFLKLLTLFSKDIIDATVLMRAAESFLGDGDLMAEFRELMGYDNRLDGVEYGPTGSIRIDPSDMITALPVDDGEGPSYRRLPDSEKMLACSGQDSHCRSVLNHDWVSHPAWATEEAGFVAHKKNSFEEILHKCEEERHEFHVQIEALNQTLSVLEPIQTRLHDMTTEERAEFKLNADFGGRHKSIYHRVIKKIYGREAGMEVIQALQDCPSVALPVVLARLKQRDREWRQAKRDLARTWREIEAKNFYKSLDHQGISFKANDKKNITAKHFMADIESIKAEQLREREGNNVSARFHGSVGFQLEYSFQDTSVLHDLLKLVYSFLDHSQMQYSPQERRSVEKFLRSFIPLLCMCPAAEFNAGCGSLDGVHDDSESIGIDSQRSGRRSTGGAHSSGVTASVLRKKLLKTVQEKRGQKEGGASVGGSRVGSPTPGNGSPHASNAEGVDKALSAQTEADDVWIRETLTHIARLPCSGSERRPLFANTTFYTLLRLLQLLYSRLLMCKEIGAKSAAEKHASFADNPISAELGLVDPNGPSAVLAQAMSDQRAAEGANVTYTYLLDACEKVFDNELDQTTFEEHMRWFFTTKAYHVFTLDKVITALVKQVQTILSDHKCQEFLFLMQNSRNMERVGNRDIIRYRREAEGIVGAEDPIYRLEWEQESKVLRIGLVGEDDPSVEGDGTAISRWQEYVDTYVMEHATEWMPRSEKERRRPGVFLRRCRSETQTAATRQGKMAIRISFGTYKLFYEEKSEEVIWRKWEKEEEERLEERAKAREEERLKRFALI